jgi:hypothetical protein
MGHMYIRHAVGSRLLWDSLKHNCSYKVEQIDANWKFVIEVSDHALAEQVISNRNDLNIFVVADNDPNHKTWYYSTQGLVEYHAESREITIIADMQMDYVV